MSHAWAVVGRPSSSKSAPGRPQERKQALQAAHALALEAHGGWSAGGQ